MLTGAPAGMAIRRYRNIAGHECPACMSGLENATPFGEINRGGLIEASGFAFFSDSRRLLQIICESDASGLIRV